MTTPTDMILRSMRLIGKKPVGGTLSAAEGTAYLADMNTMIDGWGIDNLLIYQLLLESHALTTSVGVYEIGAGSSTWNTATPLELEQPCYIRDSGNIDRELFILDDAQYGRIILKTLDGDYPRYINYQLGSSTGTISLWPEPVANLTLYISSWKGLQNFQALTTPLNMPKGFQRAIEFNYAIEISGGFKSVPAEVVKIARESLAAIKQLHAPSGVLRLDPGVMGRRRGAWDIRTG